MMFVLSLPGYAALTQDVHFSRFPRLIKIIKFLYPILAFFGSFALGSRLAIMLCLISSSLYYLMFYRRKFYITLFFIVFLLACVSAIFGDLLNELFSRFADLYANVLADNSFYEKLNFWSIGLDINQNLFFGNGINSLYVDRVGSVNNQSFFTTESSILDTLFQEGIIGILLLFLPLMFITWRLLKIKIISPRFSNNHLYLLVLCLVILINLALAPIAYGANYYFSVFFFTNIAYFNSELNPPLKL